MFYYLNNLIKFKNNFHIIQNIQHDLDEEALVSNKGKNPSLDKNSSFSNA